MRRGKYQSKKRAKGVALLVVLTLLLGCGIGGTLAWLMDTTDAVTNTFTAGNVDITLKESPYDAAKNTYGTQAEGTDNAYPAIPGATYKKDPTVEVVAGSEDCYLFVEFKYTAEADTYLNYKSNLTEADSWKKIGDTITSADGSTKTEVWSRVVYKADENRSFALLEDLGTNYGAGITLEIDPAAVTNQNMTAAAAQTLEWTAYAVQFNYLKDGSNNPISGDSVAAATKAWAVLKAQNPTIYPAPATPPATDG